MIEMKHIENLVRAIAFAAEKHKNQRRKGLNAQPYINHPIEVAKILIEDGHVSDQDVLIAAILHDTIEDTETTPEEIASQFGEIVCDLVFEVTDDISQSKAERKKQQIRNAPRKSGRAKQIKVADKIANIREIVTNAPIGWNNKRKLEYIAWAEDVSKGLAGSNLRLDALLKQTIEYARTKIN